MKFWHIILIFAIVGASFFGLRGCVKKQYIQSGQQSLNPLSYVFVRPEWQKVANDRQSWAAEYAFSASKLEKMQKRMEAVNNLSEDWRALRDSVKAFVSKTEIVYVRRIALSPDMVMLTPSSYRETYSGNRIQAVGKGADKERMHLFYLSDGTIIRASARTNCEWLAVSVGQNVEKSYVMKMVANQQYQVGWFAIDSKVREETYGIYNTYIKVVYPEQQLWTFPLGELITEVKYKPIFFN